MTQAPLLCECLEPAQSPARPGTPSLLLWLSVLATLRSSVTPFPGSSSVPKRPFCLPHPLRSQGFVTRSPSIFMHYIIITINFVKVFW